MGTVPGFNYNICEVLGAKFSAAANSSLITGKRFSGTRIKRIREIYEFMC